MHLKRFAMTGWTALAACFLLLLATGCKRPSTSVAPPPPPSRDDGTSGSLQSAYSNPVPTGTSNSNTGAAASANQPANVKRWKVIPRKNTPVLGKSDALVTIVEFSDFQ